MQPPKRLKGRYNNQLPHEGTEGYQPPPKRPKDNTTTQPPPKGLTGRYSNPTAPEGAEG